MKLDRQPISIDPLIGGLRYFVKIAAARGGAENLMVTDKSKFSVGGTGFSRYYNEIHMGARRDEEAKAQCPGQRPLAISVFDQPILLESLSTLEKPLSPIHTSIIGMDDLAKFFDWLDHQISARKPVEEVMAQESTWIQDPTVRGVFEKLIEIIKRVPRFSPHE